MKRGGRGATVSGTMEGTATGRGGRARRSGWLALFLLGLTAALGCENPGPSGVAGWITAAGAGAPAPSARVEIFDAESPDPANPVLVAETTTDEDGHFESSLAVTEATAYRLRVGGIDWYDGAADFPSAVDVTVTPGTWTTIEYAADIDTGSVSGTVTDPAAQPMPGVTVSALRASDRVAVLTASTDGTGAYRFDALLPGSYVVRFEKAGWATRYSGSTGTFAEAPVVSVTAGGNLTGIDTQFRTPSTFTGSVTPAIAGVTIGAFAVGDGEPELLAVTQTDGAGRFTLGPLNAGAHQLAMSGPTIRPRSFGIPTFDPATAPSYLLGEGATSDLGSHVAYGADCDPPSVVTGADLSGRHLMSCDLTAKNLTDVDLTDADLTNATLSGVTLTGSKLGGAELDGVLSGGVTGTPTALPASWLLRNGHLVGPGANLTGATFHLTNLAGADLTGANLTGATFSYATLTNATLTDVTVSGSTRFISTALAGVVSGGITGNPILPAAWVLRSGYLIGPVANLTGADLPGVTLTSLNLSGADLTGANLAGAKLDLTTLTNAKLTGAILTGAKVANANLTDVTLTGVVSGGITGSPAVLPTGWILYNGHLVGVGARLAGANLTGANLTGLTLTGADLADANLTGVTLTGVVSGGITGTPAALPAGWILRDGFLLGAGANLTGANLTNVALTGADLTNAKLTNAVLASTNLSGATLTGVVSGGITGTPSALATNWLLRGGFLAGPGANLGSANLTGVNLTGANLTGANLVNANLTDATLTNVTITNANPTGATLTGVRSGGIVGLPVAYPIDWVIRSGYLVGPYANLAGAQFSDFHMQAKNLTGANLTGARFSSYDLSATNLTNANLTNAAMYNPVLSQTNFTGANLTGARFIGIQGAPLGIAAPWTIRSGVLLGPGVNLSSVGLSSMNLSNLDLTGANLAGSILTSANLSGANLTSANLAGARGTPSSDAGAIYSTTTCPDGVVVSAPTTCAGRWRP